MNDSLRSPQPTHRGPSLVAADRKVLLLATLGGALEFYDFIIFVFFTGTLGQLFFPPGISDWLRQLQTFGIFAAGYFARPLGGIIMAHFGDRQGRKRMFSLSILLMALPTLAMGFLPTYQTIGLAAPLLLLLLRLLQGAAVGGEVPGAWVFVAEHVPARSTGLACGTLTAGLTAGILLGSLAATAVNSAFSTEAVLDYAWRIPFVVGGLFGLASALLRRWLRESPVFEALRAQRALAAGLPLRTVLRDHRPAVALSVALTWLLSTFIVVLILVTPTLLQKVYGVAPAASLGANSVATLCLTAGCVAAGFAADRFGPGPVLTVGCLALAAVSHRFYVGVRADPTALLPWYALTGFLVGTISVVPLVMVRSFPAAVRFSGLSFAYNASYALFGGLTPVVVTLMLRSDALAPAHYVLAACVVGVGLGLYLTAVTKKDARAEIM